MIGNGGIVNESSQASPFSPKIFLGEKGLIIGFFIIKEQAIEFVNNFIVPVLNNIKKLVIFKFIAPKGTPWLSLYFSNIKYK